MSETIPLRKMNLVPGPWPDLVLPPEEQQLGSRDKVVPGPGSIRIEDQFEIQIGDRPQAYRLADLYRAGHRGGQPDPNVFPVLDGAEFWVVVHAMGAMKRRGPTTVRSLGYIASYPTESEVATVGMAPDSLYVENFRAMAALGAEGTVDLPDALGDLLASATTLASAIRLKLTSDVKFVGKFDFAVRTRAISTVGLGRSGCEWRFQRSGRDLYGDHLMIQTIRVPPNTPSVSFVARVYAEIGDWWELTRVPRLVWTAGLPLACSPQQPPAPTASA